MSSNQLSAVDQNVMAMLLEERYATLRVEVRDIYEECDAKALVKQSNIETIEGLQRRVNFFNKKKVQYQIDLLKQENDEIEAFIASIGDKLSPLADEMEDIESKIGDRLSLLYGKDYHWWVRR